MRGVAGARSSRRNSHRWIAYFQNPRLPTHIHALSFVERGRIFPLKLENPTVAVLRFEILPPGAYIVRRVVANEPPRRYYRSKASFLDHQNPNQAKGGNFYRNKLQSRVVSLKTHVGGRPVGARNISDSRQHRRGGSIFRHPIA